MLSYIKFFYKYFIVTWFSFSALMAQSSTSLSLRAQNLGLKLNDKQEKVLGIGEISNTKYIIGGVLGTYPGLGIGHAVQGRYSTDGWKFTVGQLGGATAVVVGAVNCTVEAVDFSSKGCSSGSNILLIGGFVTLIFFKVWEIVDVWATPPKYNRTYRELKEYIETQEGLKDAPQKSKVSFHFAPILSKDNAAAGMGLALRF